MGQVQRNMVSSYQPSSKVPTVASRGVAVAAACSYEGSGERIRSQERLTAIVVLASVRMKSYGICAEPHGNRMDPGGCAANHHRQPPSVGHDHRRVKQRKDKILATGGPGRRGCCGTVGLLLFLHAHLSASRCLLSATRSLPVRGQLGCWLSGRACRLSPRRVDGRTPLTSLCCVPGSDNPSSS